MREIAVQGVQDKDIILIIDTILRFRAENKSYRIIGEKLHMSKSEVYMILKGQWRPKDLEVKQRILARVREIAE